MYVDFTADARNFLGEPSRETRDVIGANIKKIFLNVLDNIQKENLTKMRDLIRFWFGTPNINKFSNLDPKITICGYKYNALKACTCYSQLSAPCIISKDLTDGELYNKFNELIDITVEHQNSAEKMNLHMQTK